MATFLTDRTEITKAINIDRYPTFIFDVSEPFEDYEGYYKTDACMNLMIISKRYGEMPFEGDLYIEIPRERADKTVTVDDMINGVHIGKAGHTCIKNSFGMSDVLEMAHNRALQEVRPSDIVVVVFKQNDRCYVQKMTVSERVDGFCTTMGTLKPIE